MPNYKFNNFVYICKTDFMTSENGLIAYSREKVKIVFSKQFLKQK